MPPLMKICNTTNRNHSPGVMPALVLGHHERNTNRPGFNKKI
ncbi:hypothetical protein GGU45_003792 [Niabella hirudinis]